MSEEAVWLASRPSQRHETKSSNGNSGVGRSKSSTVRQISASILEESTSTEGPLMDSRYKLEETARRQVRLTLCGAALILGSFVVTATSYALTFLVTRDALYREGMEMRRRLAESVLGEMALTLKPVYTSTRALQERALVGAARGSTIWPPTPETLESNTTELINLLWLELEDDLHLRSVDAGGTAREYFPLVGAWANIAVQEDLHTPATSMAECAGVLQVVVYTAETVEDGVLSFSDSPEKTVRHTRVATHRNGSKTMTLETRLFDSSTKLLLPDLLQENDGPSCESMLPLWGGSPSQAAFGNFSWYGPVLGRYQAIYGSVPIYTPDRQREMGFFGSFISVVYSKNLILKAILEEAGDAKRGGQLAMVSESGLLLGASEFNDASDAERPSYIRDIPPSSLLAKAISLLKLEVGTFCPAEHWVLEEEECLIDVMPFFAEDYGLPPMHERWCMIQTIPRNNLYGAADDVQRIRIVAGGTNLLLFLLAIALFTVSLYLALQSDRTMRHDKQKEDMGQVLDAMREVTSLNSPMVLLSARQFLQLTRLEPYESLRDQELLTVIDSLDEVIHFKRRNMILFFSHQWLSLEFPDAEGAVHLAAMQGAARTVLADPMTDREVYIWCDFISIAQHHEKMQRVAILSLPVYASMADKFIIIAPPAIHADLQVECNLETFNQRGWCRAEMLAKACGSGAAEMYTCTNTDGSLNRITEEDFSHLSMNVFEGEFSVPTDAEDLVIPALGLYSLVLRCKDRPHMRIINALIQKDRERFFPRSYRNRNSGQLVELFGRRVSLLEQYVAQGDEALLEPTPPSARSPPFTSRSACKHFVQAIKGQTRVRGASRGQREAATLQQPSAP